MSPKGPKYSQEASTSQAQPSMSIEDGLSLAMQHQSAGRISEAEKIYQQILEVEPNQPVAPHLLGVIALMAGQSDVGIQMIRKAIGRAPEYLSALCNLGHVFLDLGRFDEAIAIYGQVIALKPDHTETHANLALALQNSGRIDKAINSYKRSLNLDSKNANTHCDLGNAYLDGQRPATQY